MRALASRRVGLAERRALRWRHPTPLGFAESSLPIKGREAF
jgi:hypothetical protein